jgi:hypothetical protein
MLNWIQRIEVENISDSAAPGASSSASFVRVMAAVSVLGQLNYGSGVCNGFCLSCLNLTPSEGVIVCQGC